MLSKEKGSRSSLRISVGPGDTPKYYVETGQCKIIAKRAQYHLKRRNLNDVRGSLMLGKKAPPTVTAHQLRALKPFINRIVCRFGFGFRLLIFQTHT